MKNLKGYRFRIYPNEAQKRFFIETFGCVRFIYNYFLKLDTAERTSEEVITPASLKRDYPFLKKTDSLALANAKRNLDRAFQNYYQQRSGYPKLKNKSSAWQSYTTNNQNGTVRIEDGYLKLPKLKEKIQICEHRKITGTIKSVTISAKNSEEFYASILCVEAIDKFEKTGKNIRLSFDAHQLVQQAKYRAEVIEPIQQTKGRLAFLQRRLKVKARVARKQNRILADCKNYQKQKKQYDKLLTHFNNQIKDYLNHLSIFYIKEYDVIEIVELEDRSCAEDALFTSNEWHQLVRLLKYKAQWYGKEIQIISCQNI